jgi:hypothetical protein
MAHSLLTAFWIVPPGRTGPRGYGVTAYSLEDALRIIRGFGFELPEDIARFKVIAGVRIEELDQSHVRVNNGADCRSRALVSVCATRALASQRPVALATRRMYNTWASGTN